MNGISPTQRQTQLDALRHAIAVIESLPVTRACCNCEFFSETGCDYFGAMPPTDYQHGENDCAQWCEKIPF